MLEAFLVILSFLMLGILFGIGYIAYILKTKKSLDEGQVREEFSKLLQDSKILEKLTEVSLYAKQVNEAYSEIKTLLSSPSGRGFLGEMSLEGILRDQLPPDLYGVRKRILSGKVPDAYIKTEKGLILIDSKFPLENYKRYVDSKSETEREVFKREFLKDVKRHLEKVARDYVVPEEGTADVAFVYIPSEGVYGFLLENGFDVLMEYAKRGVHVVSPLTLCQKLELIKRGLLVNRLSEDVQDLQNRLERLSKDFEHFEEVWRVFFNTHFKNLIKKADELESAYKKLKAQILELKDKV